MLSGAGGSRLRCPRPTLQVIVRRCTTAKKRPGRPPLIPGGVPPNGRDLSRQLRSAIKEGVEGFIAAKGYAPQLAVLTVGPRPAEEEKRRQLFASGPDDASWFDKASAARALSMECTQVHLPVDAPLERVVSTLRALSRRRDVHGVMVELPLPPHLHEYRREIWASIDPRKDVDGMCPESCARLFDLAAGVCPTSASSFSPPGQLTDSAPLYRNVSTTALGVMEYLDAYGLIVQEGTHCLVIGRSKLVGLPIASLLLARRASVSVAHSHTSPEHLKTLCKAADVIVVAAGVPNLVQPQWVKKGTLVVNVGTTFDEDKGELLTDTQDGVRELEQVVVTPTPRREATGLGPSGVGPLTLPMVLHSTLVNALALAYDEEEKAAVHSMRGCRKDTASLGERELQQVLKKGKYKERGWEVRANKNAGTACMAKTFELCDFDEALSFCVDIKHAAEDLNHHPSLHVTKKRRVTVELTSEVVGGKLTHFDLEMADKIDALTINTAPAKPAATRGGGKKPE